MCQWSEPLIRFVTKDCMAISRLIGFEARSCSLNLLDNNSSFSSKNWKDPNGLKTFSPSNKPLQTPINLAQKFQRLFDLQIFFWNVAIRLGWILSTFVSYHIFPLNKSCVGITANRAVNNFKFSDVLPPSCFLSQPVHHPFRESEHKSWGFR